jgi:hypothetical protein
MEDQRTLRSIRDFDDQVARTERERNKEQWLASQPTQRTLTIAQMAAHIITCGAFIVASQSDPNKWGAGAAVKLATEIVVAAEASAAKEKELEAALAAKTS